MILKYRSTAQSNVSTVLCLQILCLKKIFHQIEYCRGGGMWNETRGNIVNSAILTLCWAGTCSLTQTLECRTHTIKHIYATPGVREASIQTCTVLPVLAQQPRP